MKRQESVLEALRIHMLEYFKAVSPHTHACSTRLPANSEHLSFALVSNILKKNDRYMKQKAEKEAGGN